MKVCKMAEEDCQVAVKRKKRAANFSVKEKSLLVDLAGYRAGIIECKRTDGSTMLEKEQAWRQLAEEFNAVMEQARDWKALRTVRL